MNGLSHTGQQKGFLVGVLARYGLIGDCGSNEDWWSLLFGVEKDEGLKIFNSPKGLLGSEDVSFPRQLHRQSWNTTNDPFLKLMIITPKSKKISLKTPSPIHLLFTKYIPQYFKNCLFTCEINGNRNISSEV